jgi:DNA repair ATPase RecN
VDGDMTRKEYDILERFESKLDNLYDIAIEHSSSIATIAEQQKHMAEQLSARPCAILIMTGYAS